ncbi:MAG: 7-carboxy-7-deazaguanine synthase QueE [Chitinispirillales bacterium]|jgi:7-carboxy-7-deazaguanine synthase|nr:7-carboxy-7-deazaguanine synthase QueE [Chitinispirillales bacterium]
MLNVNEIFVSIQGEGTRTGKLCTFVRLSGCSFGCYYCDTKYVNFEAEKKYSIEELTEIIKNFGGNLVEITGGEPLEQNETPILAEKLLENGFEVLIETNGSKDISILHRKVVKIVDVKLPWVGQKDNFLYKNLRYLTQNDELKFVIDGFDGYNWAKNFIENHEVVSEIIFSPCIEKIDPNVLADMIIKDKLNVRFGLQIHKILWKDKRGV